MLIASVAARTTTPETDPVIRALRDLVGQIEARTYFDHCGNLLELNQVFHEARDLVRGYPAAPGAARR